MAQRLTIPNLIALARIAMAAIAAWLAVADEQVVAVSVLIAAAWLDVLDGWYARTFEQVSTLGKHLDPLADKVLMGVVYAWIALDAGSALVWTLVACAAVRETAVTVFRSYSLRRKGRFIPASGLGRLKMLMQSVSGLTILGVTHFLDRTVPTGVVAGAVAGTLLVAYASAIAYAVEWRADLRAAARDESKGACRRPEADPLCATQHHG